MHEILGGNLSGYVPCPTQRLHVSVYNVLTQNSALLDVDDYRYNDANITALQLVDVKDAFTLKIVDEMMTYQMRTGSRLLAKLQPPYLTVDMFKILNFTG